jgi:PAS domain S-box-containing protein
MPGRLATSGADTRRLAAAEPEASLTEPLTARPPDAPGEAVFRALFENATEGMALHEIVLDGEGRPVDYVFVAVNGAFEGQTGLRRDAVVGRRVTEVLPGIERDPADWIGRYGRVALGGGPVRFQQYSAPLARWYDVSAFSPARGTFAVIFSDVTEHKRLVEALRATDERLRARARELNAVLDATHAQLALLDPELRFLLVNHAYERGCGHAREELVGRGHFEFFPHEENERIFRRVAATGEPAFFHEKPFSFADRPELGVTYWDWSLVPIRGDSGGVEAVLLSLLDVTAQVEARAAVERLAEERRRSELAARDGEARLREADRRKNEFLGVLSHELRNPLAPILNSAAILNREEVEPEQARRARAVIERQAHHLARLVDDLLDVTRISRGKIVLERTVLDARDLLRRTVEDHRGIFEQHGLELSLDIPAAPVWLEADATRLSQVVGNLLQNAAKFTPRGGRAAVCVRAADGRATIRVRDDGAGIAPELLDRVFEPFTQGERTLARTKGGLGLGLALVKGLVELHGGAVAARSDGPGAGAELVVSLPLAAAPAARDGVDEALAGAAPLTVLVVDDNLDAAQSLADVLALGGHRVHVAGDGASGVALARATLPDLVLCDIGLPDVDGYEVARTLRADASLRATRLVAVSGYAQPEDRARALAAGFEAHLAKPVALDRLAELLAPPA